MTPIEIIRKLDGYKTLASQKKLLASIPPDDNFWFEAHHGLSHFTPYPIRFILQEQEHAGLVDYEHIPNVLRMILEGMLNQEFDEKEFGNVVRALSLRAQTDEWEMWFKPVLTKTLWLPVDVTTFNEYAPEEYRVPGMPVAPQIDIMGVSSMPQEFYVEPIIEGEHIFWFLNKSGVKAYLEDGTLWDVELNHRFEQFVAKSADDIDLVLEGYMEDEVITLTDIHNAIIFMEGGRNPMPLSKRYEALRALSDILEEDGMLGMYFVPVEAHLCKLSAPETTREAYNTMIQAGFPGVYLRHDHGPRVIVRPTKKSVLTCTMITAGSGKYEGAAEYLVGDGTMNRKRFSSPVFSGLTLDDRRTILQERNQRIGKKFEVVSCGLGSDNKLVFPVFRKWRTTK